VPFLFNLGRAFLIKVGRTYLVALAYPTLGRRHPPMPSFFNLGRAFLLRVGRAFLAYPGRSCLPCTRQAPPIRAFLIKVGRTYLIVLTHPTLGKYYPPVLSFSTPVAPPSKRVGRSYLVILTYLSTYKP
jgi:hypothetical protein